MKKTVSSVAFVPLKMFFFLEKTAIKPLIQIRSLITSLAVHVKQNEKSRKVLFQAPQQIQ